MDIRIVVEGDGDRMIVAEYTGYLGDLETLAKELWGSIKDEYLFEGPKRTLFRERTKTGIKKKRSRSTLKKQ